MHQHDDLEAARGILYGSLSGLLLIGLLLIGLLA